MNIGIIAHNAHPIAQPYQGGLEMITNLLVNELVTRGHSVTTLCKEGSTLNGNMIFYTRPEITAEQENNALDEFEIFFTSATEFLKQDYDIIHNHTLSHHAIVLGNILNEPFITTFHTPIFKNLHAAINSIQPNINQTFTAVSRTLAKKYMAILPDVLPIYNGIDIEFWKYQPVKSNYFFWSGRICKEKGLKEVMDLCSKFKVKLIFAGPISNIDYYQEEIEPRLKAFRNCKYLGHLNQEDMSSWIARAKAHIFSSTWEEPYGLVIAEALASGTPVIANKIGAAPDILDETSGVLFDLYDESTFEYALKVVKLLDPLDCRARAVAFCGFQCMVDAYETLYKSLGNHKSALVL